MSLLETMMQRRSVRKFTGEPVTSEQLDQILAAAMIGPNGRNLRAWEFVVVTDTDQLARFATCRVGGTGKTIAASSAAIFVFGDTSKTDVWCEDCSVAMTSMSLMASSLGLGSCWIQGRLRQAEDGRSTNEFCREALRVPEGYELEAVLAIGVPAAQPKPHTAEDVDMSKVHWGMF